MNGFPEQSQAMRFGRAIGLKKLAWSLRRLHCPVSSSELVLDVGSGGNPYPRANVLLDAYEDSHERYHASLICDRPLVLGRAEKMPFRDKVFDFVIASHVLEHMPDPASFIRELMRVGKAGYIETPHAFFERINPWRFHRLEVGLAKNRLQIRKKPSWRHDGEVVDLFESQAKRPAFVRFISLNPDLFYTRYYWSDRIDFDLLNPEVDANWPLPPEAPAPAMSAWRQALHGCALKSARWLFSQNRRNRSINLASLLRCLNCNGESLRATDQQLKCLECDASYPMRNMVPIMTGVEYPRVGR